jgi:hypothetical protein
MSRSRNRARRRGQRLEVGLREAITRARNADTLAVKASQLTAVHGELWQLLCDIERSGFRVWEVARAVRCSEDEMAMIAQVVAPALAGMSPASVLSRRERKKR